MAEALNTRQCMPDRLHLLATPALISRVFAWPPPSFALRRSLLTHGTPIPSAFVYFLGKLASRLRLNQTTPIF